MKTTYPPPFEEFEPLPDGCPWPDVIEKRARGWSFMWGKCDDITIEGMGGTLLRVGGPGSIHFLSYGELLEVPEGHDVMAIYSISPSGDVAFYALVFALDGADDADDRAVAEAYREKLQGRGPVH